MSALPNKKLAERQFELNKIYAQSLLGANNKCDKYCIGIDVGGSGYRASVFKMLPDGSLSKEPIFKIKVKMRGGPVGFADAYIEMIQACITAAAEQNGVIAGIGIGTAGKLITQSIFKDKFGVVKTDHLMNAQIGNAQSDIYPKANGPEKFPLTENRVVASRSADNLCDKSNLEAFNGVSLEAMLRRMGPWGIPVRVYNDASIQTKGTVEEHLEEFGQDEKIFYFGPGSGVGGALIIREDGAFKIATDGHVQYIELAKRKETDPATQKISDQVFKSCATRNHKKYYPLTGKEPGEGPIRPEELLCGRNIMYTVRAALRKHGVCLKSDSVDGKLILSKKEFDKEIDSLLNNKSGKIADYLREKGTLDAAFADVCGRLQAVGRYLADYFTVVHSGEFKHMDLRAEWNGKDKSLIEGFTKIIIGGSVGATQWFQKLVLNETVAPQLEKSGVRAKFFIPPQKGEEAGKYAAAGAVRAEAASIDIEKLAIENQQIIRQTLNIRQ